MLKGILFDVDGVLIDSMRLHVDSWYEVFEGVGIKIASEDIYFLEGNNDSEIIEETFKKAGKELQPGQIEYLAKTKNEVFKFDQVEPFRGTLDCLKELKLQFTLAAVSGSNRFTVEKAINKFFPGCFEVIITGDEMERGKPYPDPYLEAIKKLNLTEKECIIVENSPLGIESANRAEIDCVAVASTLNTKYLQHANLVFKDHSALFEYLRNLVPK
jgi:beta-phosphoglucomutase